MPEWKVHSLEEVYEFASGLSKHRSEFGSGFPFLSFKDVFYNRFVPSALDNLVQSSQKERTRCSIRRGDVFLTRTSETMNELGMSCVALSDLPDATFNGFTKRLRPKVEGYILPEYAGYFFSSPRFRQSVNAMSTMSTRASLNNDMLSRLEIVVPELDEQKRIANVLKPLDDKIEVNRRMNETLEEIAQALFRDWFVDFGPTRRQMEGATDPAAIMGHAFPSEKAATLAPLFPANLDDDSLPEGWSLTQISDLCEIKSGKRPPIKVNSPDKENSIPVWGGNGVSWFTNRFLFDQPLLITGRVGTLGTVYRVKGDVWISDNAICLFPNEGFYEILFQRLKALDIKALNSGSTQPLLTQTALKKQPCIYPTKEVAARFQEIASLLNGKTALNDEENTTLAAMRDLLLPKLMSGQIRLREAEDKL